MQRRNKPEVLAPAGNLRGLKTAVDYGADAVYCGGKAFGMRSAPKNLSLEDFEEGARYAHERGARVYVTFNVLPRNNEVEAMREYLGKLKDTDVDALIVSDIGVMLMSKQVAPNLELHVSTQAGVTNYQAANAFYEAGQEFNMSVTARQFAAGILYHAAEICAVTDQYVNSYKRLWGGAEAPSYICWGHNNRSALLRIPQYKPGKGNSARMEFRALDPVANPYLAYSVLLAAGLDGIDKQMQLGEPTSDDVWELTDAERQAMGIQPLPESLDEALKIMEKSDFVASVLGEHAFEYFLRNKHQEWDEYRKQVTPFELKKYLPKL